MKQSSLVVNILFLWSFLGKKRHWQFAALFLLMLLSVVTEMVSLGAIVPFLGALTNPELLMDMTWLQPAIRFLEIKSADELLLPLTLAFVTAALLAAGLRVLLLWVNIRLSASMMVQLRSELYRRALFRPYECHLSDNSSRLISLVTEKVVVAGGAAILRVMMLIIALLTAAAIIVTLLLIDPVVALLAFGVLGGGYLLVGYVSRKMLKKNSHVIAENQPLAVKQLQEGVGGIRDVILDHTQEAFLKNYIEYVRKVQFASSNNSIISQLPKSVLELMGIVLIAGLAYFLQIEGKGALPILGALAMGSQRLLPSLQQVYFSWSTIVGAQAVIADVADYLNVEPIPAKDEDTPPVKFERSITLEHLVFRYAGTNANVLDNISLTIPKGTHIGFVGPTGSGKSTLLDVVMGLLTPSSGKMKIDGIEIDENNRESWQQYIAHVPQSIYLSDASIAENIAFGVPREQIDFDRVKQAAGKAHLERFITELPKGYDTYVGERGVQLSGGQRQRIGIARALYKQAEVIVFDEATSALDDKTEKLVMDAINGLNSNLTVLMIAHRLSTLKDCSVVYSLSRGKIIGAGTYDEICGALREATFSH
jgi:ATP-binding cassette, subfamily B, bacterial PglK